VSHRFALAALLWLTACAGRASLPGATAPAQDVNLPYLAALFHDGAVLPAGDLTVTARTQEIGNVVLPDGKIVVADAFAGADRSPLAQTVPPGEYPVVLSLITYPDSPYEAVAAALLRLAPGEPVTWRLATIPGQDVAALGADEFFGYPVDSGTALFASPAGARLFGEKLSILGVLDVGYLKQVSQAMEANAPNGGGWANLVLDSRSGANVVLFQSGYGDGVYAAYWGYDGDGTLVCLATDFDLAYSDASPPP
jgi:hypothetical protein